MKKTILGMAGLIAVAAALLFTVCDDNGLNRSPWNDGRANGFIKRFNDVNEQSVPHRVTIVSEGQGPGGGGNYAPGITVTIMSGAPPNDDMEFKEWTSNSEEVAFEDRTQATTWFNMPAKDVTVTAVFAPRPTFTVTYNLNNASGSAPYDDHSYKYGDEVIVRGSDNMNMGPNFQFAGWNTQADGKGYSYSPGAPLYITENTVLYAQWMSSSATVYNVTVINGTTNNAIVAAGSTVTITANKSAEERFVRWEVKSGNAALAAANKETTTFIMPAGNVEIAAVFEKIPTYLVTVVSDGSGSSGGGKSYKAGETVSINAGTPPFNQEFIGWTTKSNGVSFANNSSAVTTFIMPANAVTVTANFQNKTTQTQTFVLTTSVNPSGGGTITKNPNSTSYEKGVTVEVKATPSAIGNYEFTGWTGAVTSTENPVKITMDGNKSLTANFRATYSIKVNAGVGGTVSYLQASQNQYNVKANPSPKYAFDAWKTVTGTAVFSNASVDNCVVTISSNATIIANFKWTGETFLDTRNNKSYKKVRMPDGKEWMAENLNYNPGKGNRWCYDNQDSNCVKYGMLYDWATAMDTSLIYNTSRLEAYNTPRTNIHKGVCPSGWHLPSRGEWDEMQRVIAGQKGLSDWMTIAKYLKSESGWDNATATSNDEYGFSALPGGGRWENNSFGGIGTTGGWWTASDYSTGIAYENYTGYMTMNNSYNAVDPVSILKIAGFAVRCVAD